MIQANYNALSGFDNGKNPFPAILKLMNMSLDLKNIFVIFLEVVKITQIILYRGLLMLFNIQHTAVKIV